MPSRCPAQGYSEFFGYLNHSAAHDYYYDYMWQSSGLNGATTTIANNGGPGGTPEYSHDLASRRTEAFIRDAAVASDPFYLQVNYTIPHFDLEDIGSAPAMFDLAGNQIFNAGLAQYDGVAGLTDKQQKHAAMISRMDAAVGALVSRLQDPNADGDFSDSILSDTMIIFSSDNGTTPEDGLGNGTNGAKDPRISGGLKGGKRDLYEGGIRMPSFAYWAGHIEAGTNNNVLNDLSDFQATAADLAGTLARVGTDGVSILPTLLGQTQIKQREFLVFENFENSNMGYKNASWTIIRGELKLIKFNDGSFELYDVVADPGETSPLDLNSNATLKSELESLAIAEGAAAPDNYAVQYRDWSGPDGGRISDSSHWSVTDDPGNSSIGSISDTWSAVVRNTGSGDSVATVSQDINVLGFEVSGQTALQTVEVGSGATLNGRNEVRIGEHGKLQLNHATVQSRRWVEVLEGGTLTGQGSVNSNLYNSGTIAAGFDGVISPEPPTGGDFSVAIDFSAIGNEASKDSTYTPLSTTIDQGTVSFDYGPSAGSRLADRGAIDFAEEFNLRNWSTGSSLGAAINDTAFVSLSITPVDGLTVELLNAGFEFWRNGANSPTQYAIMTSLDGFTSGSELATTTLTTGGSIADSIRFAVDGTAGLSTAGILEVRLYGWNANSTTGHTHITAADVGLRFATMMGETLDPAGRLDIAGDLFHLAGGEIEIGFSGIDNSDPDNLPFDFLSVAGEVVLEGDLSLTLLGEFELFDGARFTFLEGNSIVGSFGKVTLNNAEGWAGQLIYDGTSVAVVFSAIPEPTGGAFLGMLVVGFVLCRRRAGREE